MTWKIDSEKSSLQFSVRHMVISTVVGRFREFEAEIDIFPEQWDRSRARAQVLASSVDTGDGTRDEYLRGDFLSPERFPYLTFSSSRVTVQGKKITLSGLLRIRDIERPITLKGHVRGPVSSGAGPDRLGFELKGELDREAFGLSFHQTVETVSIVVGKKVTLLLQIELVHQSD